MRAVLIVGLALAGLTACGGDPEQGGRIFTSQCAPCHGASGNAGVNEAGDLTVIVPARTDEQLEDAIINGVGTGMLPVAISDENMPHLIAYLREQFGEPQ